MSLSENFAPTGSFGNKAAITGVVLALHAAGIWALQRGMDRPPEPQIIAAEVIAQFIAPPAPEPPAPTPAPPTPPKPEPVKPPPPTPPKPQPKPKPVQKAPLPKAIADPTPAPNAPTGSLDTEPTPKVEEAPPAPPSPPTPPAAPSAPAKPAGGEVQLPSSNAAYLNNPRPNYPSISRRMGEQGKVMLRVFVDENGIPGQIEIKESSGFDRLDKAAIASVQRWRFAPGKRNGVPEGMWNIVPINFVLE